jgi:hypothetical protein
LADLDRFEWQREPIGHRNRLAIDLRALDLERAGIGINGRPNAFGQYPANPINGKLRLIVHVASFSYGSGAPVIP